MMSSLLEILIRNADREELLGYCRMRLKPLADADARQKTEYVKTLKFYIENNNNLLAASQKMYIHRNTLVNRMKKIKCLLKCDISECETRNEFYLIFKIMEYYGEI